MALIIYEYKNCGTCRNALKFLEKHKITFQTKPIRDTPPSIPELKKMLRGCGGELKKIFNTSGQDYKALNMKDKLPTLSEEEALTLLNQNGNLVKRPFVLGKTFSCVGFNEVEWTRNLKNFRLS